MEKILYSDVLVIGGGSGGCVAAIKAKDAYPSLHVTIVEKANIRRSGCLASGMDGLNTVIIPGINSIEEHLNELEKSCDGFINKRASIRLAKESFSMLHELEEWGINFPKDEKGEYFQGRKGKYHVTMKSPNIKPLLASQVRRKKIQVLQHTMATSLLCYKETVIGCTALDTRLGDFITCRAKSTILAAGGCGRFSLPPSGYLFGTFDCPANSGDAYSMAYHAGAELTGFEFIYGGYVRTKDYNSPIKDICVSHGGKVINALGNEVLPRNKVFLGQRITEEDMQVDIQKGLDPLFIDIRNVTEKNMKSIQELMFTTERGTLNTFFRGRDVDVRKDLIEIAQGDYHLCGGHGGTGIIINEEAETTLKGLYAVGDSSWVTRQWLTGAFVFGAIAGKNAAQYASSIKEQRARAKINSDSVEKEKARVFTPLHVHDGLKPAQLEYKLRRIINDYILSPKNKMKLKIALQWVHRFKKNDVNQLKASDAHELGRALEVQSILDCVEMAARASLERTESRWSFLHQRTDFPEKDDENWLKKIIIKKNMKTGKMVLAIRRFT